MTKPNEQLSARALGYLIDCVSFGTTPTIDNLWKRYKEGRGATTSALKELEDNGLIGRKLMKVGNRPQTVCQVTEYGYEFVADYLMGMIYGFPKISVDFEGSQKIAQISETLSMLTNHSKLTSKTIKNVSLAEEDTYKTHEVKVVEVPGWDGMFDSTEIPDFDVDGFKAGETFKKEQYEEKRRETQKKLLKGYTNKDGKRIKGREEKPVAVWSAVNVASEFIDRIEAIFSIPPWLSGKDKFFKALGHHRKQYGTNGVLEVKMMDLFFSTIAHDRLQSGEMAWKYWLSLWPKFLPMAQGEVSMESHAEDDLIQAERSQGALLD